MSVSCLLAAIRSFSALCHNRASALAEVSLWRIQDLDFKISSLISKVLKVLKIALKDYLRVLILFVLLGFIIHG